MKNKITSLKVLFVSFFITLFVSSAHAARYSVDEVRVYKSKHRMDMLYKGKVTKSYKVALGKGGSKPKRQEGDNRVPEGKYTLDYKNPHSNFHKSLHISYPNEDDIRRAYEMGVDPGGDIMVHGYPNDQGIFKKLFKWFGGMKNTDWTRGCVATNDKEIDEIYENVEVGTPITIFP